MIIRPNLERKNIVCQIMSISRFCNSFIKLHASQSRLSSTVAINNNEISPMFTNRNPRNLERLRIGYKPDGFHVDKPGKTFWHKLKLAVSGRYITASVSHFQNGEVLKASTQEWNIKKQLYKTTDTAAYVNLGRVLAQRCLQSGITEMTCDIQPPSKDGKVAAFLKAIEEGGISLTEPQQFKAALPWDQYRPEKPWEVPE